MLYLGCTAIKTDDVLIVWELDHLGRSLHGLIGLLDDLKTWGVAFRSVTELSAQQVAHARKLREQGESPMDIAQSLSVSRRTLYRAFAARTGEEQRWTF